MAEAHRPDVVCFCFGQHGGSVFADHPAGTIDRERLSGRQLVLARRIYQVNAQAMRVFQPDAIGRKSAGCIDQLSALCWHRAPDLVEKRRIRAQ